MADPQDNSVKKARSGYHPLLRRLWRISAGAVASVIIVVAIIIGLLRFVAPMAPAWRADAERMASEAIGFPVSIGALDLQFDWLQPEIVLRDVALLEPETRKPLVTAAQLSVVLEASDLLHLTELRPHRIIVFSPQADITITEDERVLVGGFDVSEEGEGGRDWRELLKLALQRVDISVRDANLRFQYRARDIEDWEIRDLDVNFSSDGTTHAISINLLPPSLLGKVLELEVEANGEPGFPEEWRWQASVHAQSVDIATLRQQVRWPGLGNFSGNFDFIGEFSGTGIGSFTGRGKLAAASLLFGGLSDALEPIDRLAFGWELRHGSVESELRLDGIELERKSDGEGWPESYLSLDWHHPAEAAHRLELVANFLSLEELRVIAASLPRGQDADDWTLFDWIAEVRPEGQVTGLILDVPLDNPEAGWRVEGEFTNLHTTAVRGLPGIEGLSGRISGLRESGIVQLAGSDMMLRMPDMFRDAVPVSSLQFEAGWQRFENRWRLTSENLQLELPILDARGAVQLELPDDGEPEIVMTATASNIDLAQKSAFLPVGIMGADLVKWLDRGVVDGRIPTAKIRWQGTVNDFPYRNEDADKGDFNVAFTLQDTIIDYVPGWPRIEGLQADVEFFGPGMRLEILKGRTGHAGDLKLESGQAQLREFRDNLLEIQADITGDTGDMQEFIRHSPLAERLRGVTENVELQGPARANVNIDVPLLHSIDTRLDIDLALKNVNVQATMLPWPVEDLNGQVRITEKGAWAESLQGRFHGEPLQASLDSVLLDSVPGSPEAVSGEEQLQHVQITAAGIAAVNQLDQWLPAHWRPPLDGSIEFTTDVRLPVKAEGRPIVEIRSTLTNLASSLPVPLTKPAGESWPGDFVLTDTGEGSLNLRGTVNNDMSLQLAFLRDGQGGDQGDEQDSRPNSEQDWFIERGKVMFGSMNVPDLPDAPGIYISGELEEFAPLQWVALEIGREVAREQSRTDQGAQPATEESGSLREVDLAVRRMWLADFDFAEQHFALVRMPESWNIALDGESLQGSVIVPTNSGAANRIDQGRVDQVQINQGPIELDLDRLYLETPEGVEFDGSESDPRDFPAAQLDIRDFRIGRIHLGHLQGMLKRTNIGFITDNLTATGKSHRITASGRWEYLDDGHYTSVKTEMTSTDLEAALSALGYRAGVESDDARASMDLTWHAPPFGWAPERLNGEVSLDFKDGRIEEVSQGAGRIFGLLSIGALPRRLLLDFSDVFESGLPFDTLQGNFVVSDGSAYTTNLRMKGPSMAALIVGRTGIAAKDYDQLVIVDPNVGGSLPLAGALAAGPNVGAAILLLSQLLKSPLSDIAQVKYRITGSWEDPTITKVESSARTRHGTGQGAGQDASETDGRTKGEAGNKPGSETVNETANEAEEPGSEIPADAESNDNDEQVPESRPVVEKAS